jgi:hypothetical protein
MVRPKLHTAHPHIVVTQHQLHKLAPYTPAGRASRHPSGSVSDLTREPRPWVSAECVRWRVHAGADGKRFWMVSPFLPALKKWIKKNKGKERGYAPVKEVLRAKPHKWHGNPAWLGFAFDRPRIAAHLPVR